MARGHNPGYAQRGGNRLGCAPHTRRKAVKDGGGIRVTMILKNTGDALRFYRLAANLTQGQLAEISGVTAATISSAERAKIEPNWVTMCLLVDGLNRALKGRQKPLTLDDFRTDTSAMRHEEIIG